ncbi:dynein regulatory complex subunit 4-like [Genypterus blacodes]|uniref:dynein regulatory complex subunit 4-like n=1 Tax=Genypterus blacodes TaxID=154954 RepID=UPI003F769708
MPADAKLEDYKAQCLKVELDSEHEELKNLKLEGSQLRSLWAISKARLEENKAEQRNRQREKLEAELYRRGPLAEFELKVKQVHKEKRDAISGLAIDSAVSSALNQLDGAQTEDQLLTELHTSKLEVRHNEHTQEQVKMGFKLKHDDDLSQLEKDFMRRLVEMDMKNHDRKMRLFKKQAQRWKRDTKWTEEQQSVFTTDLMRNLNKTLYDYHKQSQDTQTQYMKDLIPVMRKLSETESAQELVTRKLGITVQELKHLSKRIQKGEEQLDPECFRNYDSNQKLLAATTEHLKAETEEDRELQIEIELLQQAFEKVERERDKLRKRQKEALLWMQQKSCLRRMLAGSSVPSSLCSQELSLAGRTWSPDPAGPESKD